MLEEKNIIYFDPFYFKNGNAAKPKYFVVLKVESNNTIIASLPSSKNYLPNDLHNESGCIEDPERDLNCFVITTSEIATECGKSLPLKTYIYGHQLDDFEISYLKSIYRNEGIDFTIFGKMDNNLYSKLIDCLKKSSTVKNKFRKKL